MDNAEVLIKFKADDNDVTKKTSELSSKLGSVAKGIGTAFVAGTVVAGGALAGLVGESVKAAGDLEQQIGGTEAVFGEFAEQVQSMSKTAFSSAGLSANDYMATINKMGALMQGSGLDTQKSMELSSQAMQRAADVASIMGIDIQSAMDSIAGAAKGNFTMMDNLGVAMNATTIEAYALSKGINKSYNQMSKAEQVEMAMQMFLEKSSYAMGNYTKENETFAGSLSTMRAAIGNFMSGAGNVDDVINSVVSFGEILVQSIGEMAPKITEGLVQLINGIIPQLPIILQQLLPSVLEGAILIMQGLIEALPTFIEMLVGMLPTIIEALSNGLVTIITVLAEQLPTLLPLIIDSVLGILPILIDHLPEFIEAGFKLIIGLVTGLINSIPTLLSKAVEIGWSLIKSVAQVLNPSSLFNIGKQMLEGLWNGISNVKNWILDKIKGIGSSVLGAIKGIFGIHSPSKEFAIIGEYNMLGLEKGMEDMQPEIQRDIDGMFDLSPNMTSSMNNVLSPNIQVINDITMQQDPLGQMVNTIKTFSGGSKNDYNYGAGV